jgi:hypothetical protein
MFVTRRPCGAKAQVKGAQGPADRPNPMVGRPHFELVRARTWRPRSHVGSEEDPIPRVGGNRGEWPTGHVDGRLAVHHLQTELIKLMEAPLYPYIRIPSVEFTDTILFL